MDRVAESGGGAPRAPGAEGEFGRSPCEEAERGPEGMTAVRCVSSYIYYATRVN